MVILHSSVSAYPTLSTYTLVLSPPDNTTNQNVLTGDNRAGFVIVGVHPLMMDDPRASILIGRGQEGELMIELSTIDKTVRHSRNVREPAIKF